MLLETELVLNTTSLGNPALSGTYIVEAWRPQRQTMTLDDDPDDLPAIQDR